MFLALFLLLKFDFDFNRIIKMGSKKAKQKIISFKFDNAKQRLVKVYEEPPESPEVQILDHIDDVDDKVKLEEPQPLLLNPVLFPCSICNISLPHHALIEHSLKTHLEAKPFICPKNCSQRFRYSDELNGHDCQTPDSIPPVPIKKVVAVPFPKCDICGQIFRTMRLVISHRNHEHKNYGPLQSVDLKSDNILISCPNLKLQKKIPLLKPINQKFCDALFKLCRKSSQELGFTDFLEKEVPTVQNAKSTPQDIPFPSLTSSSDELTFSFLSQKQNSVKLELEPSLSEITSLDYRGGHDAEQEDEANTKLPIKLESSLNDSDDDFLPVINNSESNNISLDQDPEMPKLSIVRRRPIIQKPTLQVESKTQPLLPLIPPKLTKIDFDKNESSITKSRGKRASVDEDSTAQNKKQKVDKTRPRPKRSIPIARVEQESEEEVSDFEPESSGDEFEIEFDGDFPCGSCNKRFDSRNQRLNHVKNQHPEDLYSCSKCPQKFVSAVSFSNHKRKQSCREAVTDHVELEYKLAPDGIKVLCPECKKPYSRGNLRRHITGVHYNVPRRKGGIKKKRDGYI